MADELNHMQYFSVENKTPTISVIVAAYNIAGYIRDCLASLLVPDATDCEIIVIDDGSTDATPEVIATFNDRRLRVIRQPNGGLGHARNTGLDAANGDYILFVDGDDWVEPELVPLCLEHIREKPEADLFVFDYVDITPGGQVYRRCGVTFWDAKSAAWNKLYSRRLINDDRFDEDIWYEDLAIVRPWVARAEHAARIDAVLYNYRFSRPDSIMNSIDLQRLLDLPLAVNRCVARIEADERRRNIESLDERLGLDWKSRLYTVEAFIQGVINRGCQIPSGADRLKYVKKFTELLDEPEHVNTQIVRQHYGLLVATASHCHLKGAHATGDFLLHRLRDIKQGIRAKFFS